MQFPDPYEQQLMWLLDCAVAPFVRRQDVLIVNGFMRGGTTWVAELLCRMLNAKQVFEPLGNITGFERRFAECGLRDVDGRAVAMPFDRDGFFGRPLTCSHLRCTRRSLLRHRWTRWGRTKRECLRRRVVVKFVRGHMCLPSLSQVMGAPVLHIRRDPVDVLQSIRRAPNFGGPLYQEADLDALLPLADAQFLELIKPISAVMNEFQNHPSPSVRLGLYWAITEYCAARGLEECNGILVHYENVRRDRFELGRALERLGVNRYSQPSEEDHRRKSVTTGVSDPDREKGRLETQDVETIYKLAGLFGVATTG